MVSKGYNTEITTLYRPEDDEPFRATIEFLWEYCHEDKEFKVEIIKIEASDGCDDVPYWVTEDMCINAVYENIMDVLN